MSSNSKYGKSQLAMPGLENCNLVVIKQNLAQPHTRPINVSSAGFILRVRVLVIRQCPIRVRVVLVRILFLLVTLVISVTLFVQVVVLVLVVITIEAHRRRASLLSVNPYGMIAITFLDLEALVNDAHVAELNLWPQHNNVDNLQSQVARIYDCVDISVKVGNVERAEVWYRWQALQEVVLSRVS